MTLVQWPPDPARPDAWWDEFWSRPDHDFGPPSARVLEAARSFQQGRAGRVNAVDVAAGNGRYAIALAHMGFSVTALEQSGEGVKRIAALAEAEGVALQV